jgi:MinD superfamily P-loop ATPase
MPYVVNSNCILCGACVSGCESNAIMEGDTQSHIDVTICIECGTCKINCPSNAIDFVDDVETAVQPASKENSS